MSEIASHITADCILLCNESFASTNEREGSQIARQVVRALLEEGVKVVFVTHMFDLADGFHRRGSTPPVPARRAASPTAALVQASRASRCRPATARTPTGASSAPPPIPRGRQPRT